MWRCGTYSTADSAARAGATCPCRVPQVITAGSYGVKVWVCEMDHEAYRNDKDVDPYSIPRTQDGQVVPWGFGKYQQARQRLQLKCVR